MKGTETDLSQGRTVVICDADISDLVPVFLENREEDVRALEAAILAGDFQDVQSRGHSMKGAGGGYGFPRITEIGAALEDAGREKDAAAATGWTRELGQYLQQIEVRYE